MTSNDRSSWAQIVLDIREGHGLGSSNMPLVIVASLNKNRLESDVINPLNTKLEVEFVWEGEMKEVKRLKQANTSIKVECFSILSSQRRDKVGYVVISLRQAVLILRDKKNSAVEAWHKLMGVRPELKKSEPKLLLALSLREKTDEPTKEIVQANADRLIAPVIKFTPLLLADEGCVQIGPRATTNTMFQFYITIKSLTNLHCMLGDDLRIFSVLTVGYNVMSYAFDCKISAANLTDNVMVNDTKVINVRSSLTILKNYFAETRIVFKFKTDDERECGQAVLDSKISLDPLSTVDKFSIGNSKQQTTVHNGSNEIRKQELISTGNLSEFDKQNGSILNSTCQIQMNKVEANDRKSWMDTSVQLVHNKTKETVTKTLKTDTPMQGGDMKDIPSIATERAMTKPSISLTKEKPATPPVTEKLDKVQQIRRDTNEPEKETSRTENSQKYSSDNSLHHYTLRISFEYVKFDKLPANGNFNIRIKHKSAEVLSTAHDLISVTDLNKVSNLSHIDAELRLQSTADQIHSLLLNESTEVQICDTTGVFAAAILDLGILFSQPKTDFKSLESPLICDKSKQEIGQLVARLSLRDCGVLLQKGSGENYTGTKPNKPVAFDRSLAERIVEELEDWKERQQQLFSVELKKKESEHLGKLTAESMARRKEIENNLYENVNKYQEMAAALNEANDKIKEVARQNEEKERQLKLEEADLHRKFNIKLQELREASKRMEADVNHKLSLASTERDELVDKINHMIKAEKRAERLKQTLEEEIDNLRSKTVGKEEFEKVTRDLKDVEQKLNSALESKAFYKAQWGKSVREIHRLKRELQDAMDEQMQRERLEVFKIKMSQQAKEQENELMDDRSMLKNLQKETQDFMMKKCSTLS